MSRAGMAHDTTVPDSFECVFAAIYGRPLALSHQNMMTRIGGILHVAEYLGSVHVVSRQIDSLLLEFGQELYQSIASDPVQWGLNGLRMKSFNITKEALIHLVGKWKDLDEDVRRALPSRLSQLCENKARDLDRKIDAVNRHLIGHYLPAMIRDAGQTAGAKYSTGIMMWMAASAAKTYMAHIIYESKTEANKSFNWGLYKTISDGGPGYLVAADLVPFFALFNMKARGKHSVECHVEAMKAGYSEIVAPLMINNSNLRGACPTQYFLCTDIQRDDMRLLWDEASQFDWADRARESTTLAPNPPPSSPLFEPIAATAMTRPIAPSTPVRGSSAIRRPTAFPLSNAMARSSANDQTPRAGRSSTNGQTPRAESTPTYERSRPAGQRPAMPGSGAVVGTAAYGRAAPNEGPDGGRAVKRPRLSDTASDPVFDDVVNEADESRNDDDGLFNDLYDV
jgi:hypothetical protein